MNSSKKNQNPKKLKSARLRSALLNLPEVMMTRAVHSEAIAKMNKNQDKYLFIY